jgi:PD-(D/E)XK endonuclease
MKVAVDLMERGCQVSLPFGEDCDYDLIADKDGSLHRVQVKYTSSDGHVIVMRCRSHSLTNGKVRATKHYTAATIDWIAVYDRTTDRCYYCPAAELGPGRSSLRLRLTPAKNAQVRRIRNAGDYLDPDFSGSPRNEVEPAGFEPATFAMQARRSAN